VVNYTYDPWGKPTITGDEELAALNPCSYRGYDYDEETGYYYLQSRYYDPLVKRFVSEDDPSMVGVSDNITGNNAFLYCFNCAINYRDTNGFWAEAYSGFRRTNYGFSVNYSSKFLSKTHCLSYAADVIRSYGGWSLRYGNAYKKMGKTRIAKELFAHAILYCIGKGLLASSLRNAVLNTIIKRFAGNTVLKSLTTASQKINYIQYKLGYYLFDHSRVIDVNNNEKWYRLIVFDLIWAVL
jgi:RHS repeat-associated protein